MNKTEFKRAMCCGLGRCATELSASENIKKYKDIVLWGCLHNLSYDKVCEGTRAFYVYKLTEYFQDEMYFLAPVAQKFLSFPFWVNSDIFAHCCELLCCFAESGNDTARQILEKKYTEFYTFLLNDSNKTTWKKASVNFEYMCVLLDSLYGFPFFRMGCKDMGRLFLHKKHADFSWFYHNGEDKFGKKRVQTFLKKKAVDDIEYAAFYERLILENESEKKPYRKESKTDKLIEKLKNGTENLQDRLCLRRIKNTELTELISEMIKSAKEEKRVAQLLQCLDENCPITNEELMDYYKKGSLALKREILRILSERQGSGLHDFALEVLQEDTRDGRTVRLLLNNFLPGDEKILLSALKKLNVDYTDGDNWHDAFSAVLLADLTKVQVPKDVLYYIYENSLCSFCRDSALRLLVRKRWLTEDILNECLYDSNCEIRLWADKKVSKKSNKNV